MDGVAGMNGGGTFVDDLDSWSQQVEYRDIKARQQLAKQHYGSPMGSPTHSQPDAIAGEDVKVSLADLDGQTQDYAEMEKLSREYQSDVQACFSVSCFLGNNLTIALRN